MRINFRYFVLVFLFAMLTRAESISAAKKAVFDVIHFDEYAQEIISSDTTTWTEKSYDAATDTMEVEEVIVYGDNTTFPKKRVFQMKNYQKNKKLHEDARLNNCTYSNGAKLVASDINFKDGAKWNTCMLDKELEDGYSSEYFGDSPFFRVRKEWFFDDYTTLIIQLRQNPDQKIDLVSDATTDNW